VGWKWNSQGRCGVATGRDDPRTTDCNRDSDSTANSSSTANRISTATAPRSSPASADKTRANLSIALVCVAHEDALGTARARLPRAFLARRIFGRIARNLPFITHFEHFYTPDSWLVTCSGRFRNPTGRGLLTTGTESCPSDSEDRLAVRFVSSRGGVGSTSDPGSTHQIPHWVTTSDDTMGRRIHRVGLKGAALSILPPTTRALD
jgi:hypothetical protein